jgi:cytochrome c oxidase subunit 2
MQAPAHPRRLRALTRFATMLSACIALLVCAACGRSKPAPEEPSAYTVPDTYEIEITGHDFRWHVRYPGRDGKLGTKDDVFGDRHVHVPRDRRVRMHLRSEDYVYSLALPQLGLKEIAVPDLSYALEFAGVRVGTYELRGAQMCGYTHPELIGTLVVEPLPDFLAALERMQVGGSSWSQ